MRLSLQLDFIMSLSRVGMASPSSSYLPPSFLCGNRIHAQRCPWDEKSKVGLSKEGYGHLVLISDKGSGTAEKEISGLMVEKDGV